METLMADSDQQIPASLILELLREVKDAIRDLRGEMLERFEQVDKRFEQVDKRFEQVDKRFEQVDKRFEQVDKQFEQMAHRMDRAEDLMRDDRRKPDDVYEVRDRVKITFGWQWGLVSLFIAVIAAGITKIFG